MKRTLLATLAPLLAALSLQAQSDFSPQSMLKPKVSGIYTVPPNVDARTAFDALGTRAGINMVYIPAFKQDVIIPVRIEGRDFFDTMARLAEQTKTFWFAWNNNTIILAPDTQQYRRDFEPLMFKTFYLGDKISNTAAIETQLAVAMGITRAGGSFLTLRANALTVKNETANIAKAEQAISAKTLQAIPVPSAAPMGMPSNETSYVLVAENGKVRRLVSPSEEHIEKALSSVSIDSAESTRAIYENLLSRASLNVVFDRTMRERPGSRFHVEGVSLYDALELLAIQTATSWQSMSASTVYVMDNNMQNIRDRARMVVKVIYLPETFTNNDIGELLSSLRTSLSLRSVFASESRKAILVKDTPLRILLTERFIDDLTRKRGKVTSYTVTPDTSSIYAENGWILGNATRARGELEVKLRNKTSIRTTATTKEGFQKLADLAGVEVKFDARLTDAPETTFTANNVDILEALDLLAWQTRTFWQVVDKKTIRVIPDSQGARRDLEPMIEKTIVLANTSDAEEVLNILQRLLGLIGLRLDEKKNLYIRQTPDNIEMTEKVVEALGKGSVR
jgi:hypothetical protein